MRIDTQSSKIIDIGKHDYLQLHEFCHAVIWGGPLNREILDLYVRWREHLDLDHNTKTFLSFCLAAMLSIEEQKQSDAVNNINLSIKDQLDPSQIKLISKDDNNIVASVWFKNGAIMSLRNETTPSLWKCIFIKYNTGDVVFFKNDKVIQCVTHDGHDVTWNSNTNCYERT